MGRKKGSGEGSIYRSGKGWRGQLSVNGRRISVSGKTKSEVIDKIAEIRTEKNHGTFVDRNDITIGEYMPRWLKREKKPHLSEQSYIRLEAMVTNHILPYFGDLKIQEVTRYDLEERYAMSFQQKKGKMFKEKQYSHEYVNGIAVQMKKMFFSAMADGIITSNPHEGVQLHKLRPPKKIEAYSREDQEKIVAFTKEKWLDWIFYFLIATGMRFGEAAALTWDDVDLEKKTIRVHKTSVEIHGTATVQDHPKTDHGNRTISISKTLAEFLTYIKGQYDPDLNYRNLVLPNTRYGIRGSANTSKRWKEDCAAMGIPYKGKHALRHTWATRALEEGIDVKVVSAMLGHKNVITTMNIYQDVSPQLQKSAVDKLDDLL